MVTIKFYTTLTLIAFVGSLICTVLFAAWQFTSVKKFTRNKGTALKNRYRGETLDQVSVVHRPTSKEVSDNGLLYRDIINSEIETFIPSTLKSVPPPGTGIDIATSNRNSAKSIHSSKSNAPSSNRNSDVNSHSSKNDNPSSNRNSDVNSHSSKNDNPGSNRNSDVNSDSSKSNAPSLNRNSDVNSDSSKNDDPSSNRNSANSIQSTKSDTSSLGMNSVLSSLPGNNPDPYKDHNVLKADNLRRAGIYKLHVAQLETMVGKLKTINADLVKEYQAITLRKHDRKRNTIDKQRIKDKIKKNKEKIIKFHRNIKSIQENILKIDKSYSENMRSVSNRNSVSSINSLDSTDMANEKIRISYAKIKNIEENLNNLKVTLLKYESEYKELDKKIDKGKLGIVTKKGKLNNIQLKNTMDELKRRITKINNGKKDFIPSIIREITNIRRIKKIKI